MQKHGYIQKEDLVARELYLSRISKMFVDVLKDQTGMIWKANQDPNWKPVWKSSVPHSTPADTMLKQDIIAILNDDRYSKEEAKKKILEKIDQRTQLTDQHKKEVVQRFMYKLDRIKNASSVWPTPDEIQQKIQTSNK